VVSEQSNRLDMLAGGEKGTHQCERLGEKKENDEKPAKPPVTHRKILTLEDP